MRKPQCYVSYCEKDATVEKVNSIVSHIQKLSEDNGSPIEFLFDKSLNVGDNINKFMDKLKTVDSVIVICTPEYKLRAESTEEHIKTTGVFKEVEIMVERLSLIKEYEEKKEDYTEINFKIFPLVLNIPQDKGSGESVPKFIEHLMRKKINEISFEKLSNGKLKISAASAKKFRNVFLECISATTVISAVKSEYRDMEHHEKMQTLIFNKKDERAPILGKEEFVNTAFYERICNQSAYILIGRKGSGKSTTASHLYKQNGKKYKGRMELDINEISLDRVYNYIFHSPFDENMKITEIRSDLTEIFTYEKLIEYTWLVYIHLYSMYIVSCEYKLNQNSLTSHQVRNMKCVVNKVSDVLNKISEKEGKWENTSIISPTLYFYALSNTYSFFNNIINSSRCENEYFVSDIQAQLNDYALMKYIFGDKIIESFNCVLENCSRNILFTLDGIDVAADVFRKGILSSQSNEKNNKACFEIRWIFSLLELIDRIKVDFKFPLYRRLELCFSIPKDKFIEIQQQNRDKYKYGDKYCGLDWSAIELLIMLRKRMESIAKYPLESKDKKEKNPEEIFDMILNEYYKGIPKYVPIITNSGREYKMHIFHYMLRNSFWRPRDILTSLDIIMRLYYTTGNRITPLTEINIKNAIKTASEYIVNSEFYQEFSSTWKDIERNISLFNGKNILMEIEEFNEIITSKSFKLQIEGFEKPILEINDITKFLYEIGFIGVFVTNEYMKKYNMITNQGFVFYEGMSPLKGLKNGNFKNCKIMINPVFVEKLHLYVNTDELIGVSDWEVLRELEKIIRLKMSTDCFGNV